MPQLTCQNLIVGYSGKPLTTPMQFSISQGDYVCIIGENGAGKSTLMKTLLGLIPPIAGQILVGDALSKHEIGYLPQQSLIQRDFPASVREIVLSGCQARMGLRPFYNRQEKDLAYAAMKQTHILPLSRRCYRTLSGGQQQRVLLARALCATQKLLLLDEPVASLDPTATADFYALLRHLNRAHQITILMISHDLQDALQDATHVLRVGNPFFFGTKEEYQVL